MPPTVMARLQRSSGLPTSLDANARRARTPGTTASQTASPGSTASSKRASELPSQPTSARMAKIETVLLSVARSPTRLGPPNLASSGLLVQEDRLALEADVA